MSIAQNNKEIWRSERLRTVPQITQLEKVEPGFEWRFNGSNPPLSSSLALRSMLSVVLHLFVPQFEKPEWRDQVSGESGEPRPWLFLCLSEADVVSLECILLPVMRGSRIPTGLVGVAWCPLQWEGSKHLYKRRPHIFEQPASLY